MVKKNATNTEHSVRRPVGLHSEVPVELRNTCGEQRGKMPTLALWTVNFAIHTACRAKGGLVTSPFLRTSAYRKANKA